MQRYFVHLHNGNKKYTPKDATVLLLNARELAAGANPDIIVRDCRVSTRYIELDTSTPDSMDVQELAGRLEAISPVASVEHIVERHVDKEEAIRRAKELFNDEKYWGTHEALEMVWKATPPGPERELVNGIILVAAALVHEQKDEHDICMAILRRAAKKFEAAATTAEEYYGIDVDRLATTVSRMLDTGRAERFTI